MKKKLIAAMLLLLVSTGCSKHDAANDPKPSAQRLPEIGDPIAYAFTQADQHPEIMLKNVITTAQSSLDIAIYSFTSKEIADVILDRKKHGLKIRIITDKQESTSKYQKQLLDELKQAGIPIKINTHSGIMHLKMTIADRSIATTGSFNYTNAAASTNDEMLVVVREKTFAEEFDNQFESMWSDTKNFADY